MSHNQTIATHDEAPPKILRVRVQGQKISTLRDTTKITYNRYIRSFAEEHARQCQEREDRRMKVEQWRKQTLGKKSATFSQTDSRNHAGTLKPAQKPTQNSDNSQTPLNPPSATAHSPTLLHAAPTSTHMAEESAISDVEESIFQIRIIGGEEVPANAGYVPLDVDSPVAQHPCDNSSEHGQSIHSGKDDGAGEGSAAASKEEDTSDENGSGKIHSLPENPESCQEHLPPTSSTSAPLPIVTIGRQRVHCVRVKPSDIMAYMGGGNIRTRPQSRVPSTTGVNHYMFRTWEEMVSAGKKHGNGENKDKIAKKAGKSGKLTHNGKKGDNMINTENGGGTGGTGEEREPKIGEGNSQKKEEMTTNVTEIKPGDSQGRLAGNGDLGTS